MSVRMGLIGLGGIYFAHAAGYRRLGGKSRVVAVCDTDPERVAAAVAEFPEAQAFQDYNQLFVSGLVDAVDIMLPHSLHEVVATAALANGINVLLEKPATPTVAGFDRLRELATRNQKTLGVAENTRFVSAYLAAKRVINEGALGDVNFVRTLICGNERERLQQTHLWKGRRDGTVGGAILDAGVHSFYLLSWQFGPPVSLSAVSWKGIPESEVEDNGIVCGELSTGARFVTEYTFTAEIPWSERVEIYGSAGSLVIDQLAQPVAKLYRNKKEYDGIAVGDVPYDPAGWKRSSIGAEVEDFVDSLAGRRPPSVGLEDVRNSLAAVEASYHSIENGGVMVRVSGS